MTPFAGPTEPTGEIFTKPAIEQRQKWWTILSGFQTAAFSDAA